MPNLAARLRAFFGEQRALWQPGAVLHVDKLTAAEAATVLRAVATMVEAGEIEMRHVALSGRGGVRNRVGENQALSFYFFGP